MSKSGAPRKTTLLAFYAVLAVMVTAVTAVVLTAGENRTAQGEIAGGYDVTEGSDRACLGERFDLRQSGRFVNLGNPEGTLSARLELDEGSLTGEVNCLRGERTQLDAQVGDERLRGRIGGEGLEYTLEREPPEPGSLT
nr:hypothetical protein [Thermoleophilaceae bacterium]